MTVQTTSVHGPGLAVNDLTVSWGSGRSATLALDGVGFEVPPGHALAVVGESGSGKTTLVRAILGLLGAGARTVHGSISLRGRRLDRLGSRELRRLRRRQLRYIPQDPSAGLDPLFTIGAQLRQALRVTEPVRGAGHRRSGAERVDEALRRAGIPDPARIRGLYPSEISGGYKQRVLIATALLGDPSLLVADEPTSALDAATRRQVLDIVDGIRVERPSMVTLLVTHDLGIALDRADSVLVLRAGGVVEHRSATDLLTGAVAPYTRELLAARPRALTAPRAAAAGAPVRALAPPAGTGAAPALQADGLVRRFDGAGGVLAAVDGVSFRIPSANTLGLVGPSGSGKSTIAHLMLRLDRPTAGTVRWGGVDPASLDGTALRRARRSVQLVAQSPFTHLDPRQTLERIVSEPLRAHSIGDRTARRRAVSEMFERLDLPLRHLGSTPRELSGGQRQRVAIARALIAGPRAVVLDEAVSALDVLTQSRLLEVLRRLQRDLGVAFLFISHDLAVVAEIAHAVVVLDRGRVAEAGSAAEVLTSPRSEAARSLVRAGASPDGSVDAIASPLGGDLRHHERKVSS